MLYMHLLEQEAEDEAEKEAKQARREEAYESLSQYLIRRTWQLARYSLCKDQSATSVSCVELLKNPPIVTSSSNLKPTLESHLAVLTVFSALR